MSRISGGRRTETVPLAHIVVLPTAGQIQLNRMVGAYSSAIVLVAISPCKSRPSDILLMQTHLYGGFGRIVECETRSRSSTPGATDIITVKPHSYMTSHHVGGLPCDVDKGPVALFKHERAHHLGTQENRLTEKSAPCGLRGVSTTDTFRLTLKILSYCSIGLVWTGW